MKNRIKSFLTKVRSSQQGQGIVEYVVLASVFLLLCIPGILSLTSATDNMIGLSAERIKKENNIATTMTPPPATLHSWGAPIYTWTVDGHSCKAERVCSTCGEHKESEDAIITSTRKTNATCYAKGTTTYVATFINPAFNVQTKDVQDIATLSHDFSAEVVTIREPNCTTNGLRAQYCMRDGCTATQNETVIPATGHAYGPPTYSWNSANTACTAKRICQNDVSHVDSQNGTVTMKGSVPATCTENGTTQYMATFTGTDFATQTKSVQTIAALGHNYSSVYSIDKAATCTATGIKSQHCQRFGCDSTQNVTTIEKNPANHSGKKIEGGSMRTEATSTQAATRYYKWSCCGVDSTEYYTPGAPLQPEFTGWSHEFWSGSFEGDEGYGYWVKWSDKWSATQVGVGVDGMRIKITRISSAYITKLGTSPVTFTYNGVSITSKALEGASDPDGFPNRDVSCEIIVPNEWAGKTITFNVCGETGTLTFS